MWAREQHVVREGFKGEEEVIKVAAMQGVTEASPVRPIWVWFLSFSIFLFPWVRSDVRCVRTATAAPAAVHGRIVFVPDLPRHRDLGWYTTPVDFLLYVGKASQREL
jgi:hypothetical protein